MNGRVVAVGDLVLDLIVPVSLPVVPSGHQHVEFLRVEPGGAANFMMAARNIGLEVAAVGSVGDDLFGRQLVKALNDAGIETTGIALTPNAQSSVVLVLTDQQSGEHVFVGHYSEGPEAVFNDAMELAMAHANAVFVAGYTLCEKRTLALTKAAVGYARELNIPVYFDAGPMVAAASPEDIVWALANSDVLLMTEADVPLVAGGRSGDDAYAHLLAAGPRTLVVKQGPDGCTVIGRDVRETVAGFPVTVVDTVGAGDCFAAAFIAGELASMNQRDSAVLANAMGAASVQKVGAGSNAPTCAEVQAVLEQFNAEIDFTC